MKVKVYYQDFQKNAFNLNKELIFEPESAFFIREVDVKINEEEPKDRSQVANYCFYQLNTNKRILDNCQPEMIKAGHSSMSVGDYVEFEDGEIWICKAIGWDVRNKEKV